jgi:NTE family protein
MSNLDLLCGRDLDLVVCLNPMSSAAELTGGTPGERIGAAMRGLSGRRLRHEVGKLERDGTEVLILQPTADDVAVMGLNMMARGRRVEVLERARRTTALALRELRDTDQVMPAKTRRTQGARTRARRRAAA